MQLDFFSCHIDPSRHRKVLSASQRVGGAANARSSKADQKDRMIRVHVSELRRDLDAKALERGLVPRAAPRKVNARLGIGQDRRFAQKLW